MTMSTPRPPGDGNSGAGSPGGAGNVQDPPMELGLVVGVPIAAVLLLVLVLLLILWKTGKLKTSKCSRVRRRSKESEDAIREERKKSIVIIAPTGKKGAELYIARHLYKAEDDHQLSLQTGLIVEVQEKLDNGWWRGVAGGHEGWFPATFVKKIDVSDPNHSLSPSICSTLESSRPHPPPPTGKPPIDRTVSTEGGYTGGGYTNGGYDTDHDTIDSDHVGDNRDQTDHTDNTDGEVVEKQEAKKKKVPTATLR